MEPSTGTEVIPTPLEDSLESKARAYAFTLNNWTQDEYEDLRANLEPAIYYIIGKEIAPGTGTPHLQGYVYWKSPRAFRSMKKLQKRAHWAKAIACAEVNRTYCSKGGDFLEQGECPKQGKRSDLNVIKNKIAEGLKVDTIAVENPEMFHQYGRTLNKIEDILMRKKFRTVMTKGIWLWGDTGTGKSHKALENFSPETHYIYPNDNGWWDGYCQQETVVLNDFRGEIPYNLMLQMVDKWPFTVKRRGREPLPFISKTVIITSSLPPEEIYKRREEEDNIAQLIRRFKVICMNPDEIHFDLDSHSQGCMHSIWNNVPQNQHLFIANAYPEGSAGLTPTDHSGTEVSGVILGPSTVPKTNAPRNTAPSAPTQYDTLKTCHKVNNYLKDFDIFKPND